VLVENTRLHVDVACLNHKMIMERLRACRKRTMACRCACRPGLDLTR
jgi:hypothetical protein